MAYDAKKWKRICEVTLSNYVYAMKRLEKSEKIANQIIVYYSIFLIGNSVTAVFFPMKYNTHLAEYFGIMLSIIVLAYSLVSSKSRYVQRIEKLQDSINALKTIKRSIPEGDDDKLESFKKEYNIIVDRTEMRENVDFYRTVKSKCKKNGVCVYTGKTEDKQEGNIGEEVEEIKGYLSEINAISEQIKIAMNHAWSVSLFILPVVLFLSCIAF